MSQTNSRFQGGGVILPQGSSPGNINVGELALIVDSDGIVKTQNAAGTKTAIGGTTDWATLQRNALLALIPQLTEFSVMKIGQYPLGTTTTVSATSSSNSEGGGLTASAGQNNTFGSPVFQTAKTGKWGMVMRCKFGAPTTAKTAFAGLINQAQSHKVVVGTDFDAGSTTKFVLELIGGGTTAVSNGNLAADTAFHDVMMTGDGTTITAYLDGVLLGSTTTLTNISDEPLIIMVGNTTAGDAVMTKVVYGYIAP